MEIKKEILDINISEIISNRFQPRMIFDSNKLNELSNSIKKYGVINPILVRKLNDKYEIISGERRYKAAILAGLTTIPSIVGTFTDSESAELALVENVQRQDLSSLEEAKSYENLMTNQQYTKEQVTSIVSKNIAFVDGKLKLLELTKPTKEALLNKLISDGHAKIILKLKDKSKEQEVLTKIINDRLTVKETDDYVHAMNENVNTFEQDIVNLKDLNNPDILQENVNEALNNLNIISSDSNINESQEDINRKEYNMNNNEVNNNQGLNSFTPSNQSAENKFFPSMEDQQVNMNTINSGGQEIPQPGFNVGQPESPVIPEFNPNVGQPNLANGMPSVTEQPIQTAMPSFGAPDANPPVMPEFNPAGGQSNSATGMSPVTEQPIPSAMPSFGAIGANPPVIPEFNPVEEQSNLETGMPPVTEQPIPSVIPSFGGPQMAPPMEQTISPILPEINPTGAPVVEQETPMGGQSNPAVDNLKKLVAELQNNGFQISIQESDTPTDFQLIINVKK